MELRQLASRVLSANARETKHVLDWLRRFASSSQARLVVFALFVSQAVLLVFVTHLNTPPDEQNHIQFIQFYASHSLGPIFTHQRPTFNLGDKTREVDYLYHYIMSLVYRILPLSVTAKLIVLRLFSVIFGALTLLVLVRIAQHLKISAAAMTVSLLIITNLPMVLMMSSAINNDTLVWLGVALAALLLIRLWQRPTLLDLLLLAEIVIVGGLVKRTLLAFGLLFGVLGGIVLVRHFKQIWRTRYFDWRVGLLLLVLLVSSGLATERIGGNIVRYHTPTPTCEQVQGAGPCTVFWANVRARQLATQPPEQPLSPLQFTVQWTAVSFYNVVDIQTQWWQHKVAPPIWLVWLLSSTLVTGLAYGTYCDTRRWHKDRIARQRIYVALIGVSVLIIHLVYNYTEYQQSRIFGIALNGRYILPGMFLLGILSAHYWTLALARRPRLLALWAIALMIVAIGFSGLIMMLRNPQLLLG